MARISLTPPNTVSYRIADWFMRRQFGDVLDPVRAMGHHVPVMQAFGALEQRAAKWNTVDTTLKDLADMVASAKIGCPWCVDFGYWMMRTHGIPGEKVEAVPNWRDSALFTPLERLAMEYAEALTETPPIVNDDLMQQLRKFLDEAQPVELTSIICLENLRSRRNIAFGLTSQGFKARCDLPATRQLEAAHRGTAM